MGEACAMGLTTQALRPPRKRAQSGKETVENPETSSVERGGGSAEVRGSAAAQVCSGCDYWALRGSNGMWELEGWCDLFSKRTVAEHGLQCTGWTTKDPLNAGAKARGN